MALAISNVKIKGTGGILIATFQITPSGNYTTAVGGDVLNLQSGLPGLPTNAQPDFVEINSTPTVPTAASGWEYIFAKGATLATCGMQVFGQNGNQGSASPLTELGTGAYPASVTGDVIEGYAVWLGTYGQ